MKPFDPAKPVGTRAGHKARIICTDRKSPDGQLPPWPIVALVEANGQESYLLYRKDGSFTVSGEHNLDLINVPETVAVWITVRRIKGEFYFISHQSEAAAKEYAEWHCDSYICTHSTEVTLP